MQVMVFVKTNPSLAPDAIETAQDRAAMDAFNDELVAAGVRVAVGGLYPSSAGVRMGFDGASVSVEAGPQDTSVERIVGFWIWQVASLDEAIVWAKRSPFPSGHVGVLELRPLH
jgi:hypothetical protein